MRREDDLARLPGDMGTGPRFGCASRVLLSEDEVAAAEREIRQLGLCPSPDRWKSWDNLLAIKAILEAPIDRREPIADLGCRSGIVLTWLYQLGYQSLWGCDLRTPVPPIRAAVRSGLWWTAGHALRMYFANRQKMRTAAVEATRFPSEHFGAVTCMSVIEHGVRLDEFFREAARILKPRGLLVISTDYWPDGVDLKEQRRFDVAHGPDRVFTRDDMRTLQSLSTSSGLVLCGELPVVAAEPVICSSGCRYTFATLVFRRKGTVPPP